jgi:hypothetical protein
MTLRIEISDKAQARLREQAVATGQAAEAIAARLVEQAVLSPSLDEVLAPVRAEFEATGMDDTALSDLIEKAKHDLRAARQARKAS